LHIYVGQSAAVAQPSPVELHSPAGQLAAEAQASSVTEHLAYWSVRSQDLESTPSPSGYVPQGCARATGAENINIHINKNNHLSKNLFIIIPFDIINVMIS
jgi:hypothetical protein